MGKSFSTGFAVSAVLLAAVCFPVNANAADREQPRITAIQREVNLVSSDHPTRPASVNDAIVDGTAVATGTDSRAVDTNLVIFGGGSTVSIVDPLNSTARSAEAVPAKPAESEQVHQ